MIKNHSLKTQYKFLKAYTFMWWAFFSMILVFQNVFFIIIGIELHQIFLNAAISVVFSMFIVNFWSKLSDKSGNKKKYIIIGNITRAASFIFLGFVNSPLMMFIYTMIFYAGPSSDTILISYIYEISDQLNPELKKNRPVYSKIHTYAQIRKFGSIGWGLMLPFSGWIINVFGFRTNFLIAGFLLIIITIGFAVKFDEKLLITASDLDNINIKSEKSQIKINNKMEPNNIQIDLENSNKKKHSLLFNIRKILQNKQLKIFIIVTFIGAISGSLMTTVFSIFNSKFSNNNYILLGLTWSINALIEFSTSTRPFS